MHAYLHVDIPALRPCHFDKGFLSNRMLEAAMLGIPYEGGMPSVNEPWQPQLPPNPAVMAQRQLREEQDAAYQASLLVCLSTPCSYYPLQDFCRSLWCCSLLLLAFLLPKEIASLPSRKMPREHSSNGKCGGDSRACKRTGC